MESNEQDSKKLSEPITKRRKHVPNIPLMPRLNIKIEPIVIEEILHGDSKRKKVGKNLQSMKNKKHRPNVKVLSTKGIFSEGFQSELNVNTAKGTNALPSKSVTRSGSNKDANIKQEQTQSNITLIDETKELANIIQEFGEFFPVALPLTTKLNAIIHENNVENDDKSSLRVEVKKPISFADASSILMDNSNQVPSKDNYFLFQIPASYSTITTNNSDHLSTNDDGDANSQDDFDFNGNNIFNPYFTHENDSVTNEEGYLEITESGKVRLQIGDECYTLDDAIKSCFLQEVYVTESDASIDEDPIIAKVGQISNKFVCSWHIDDSHEYLE